MIGKLIKFQKLFTKMANNIAFGRPKSIVFINEVFIAYIMIEKDIDKKGTILLFSNIFTNYH